MNRTVIWEDGAVEQMLSLSARNRNQAQRIQRAVRQFARSGDGDVKKLAGAGNEWRLRVGDWRVRFTLWEDGAELHVLAVALRRDAYR
ncbi:MAG: type II toxin-antitoxin system RelE/ParE family toxin [Dehalococcoidia bacterium]